MIFPNKSNANIKDDPDFGEFKKLRQLLQRKHHIKIELCDYSMPLFHVGTLCLFCATCCTNFRLLETNGFHVKAGNEGFPVEACVVIRTSSMKIPRRHLADYVIKLHQKTCRTRSMIIFFRSTNQTINL